MMQPHTPYRQPRLSADELGRLRERATVTEDALLAKALQRLELLEWMIDRDEVLS